MRECTDADIQKLQTNLSTIRRAGEWTAEEFGDMIGVTKQTISNLESQKVAMSKTQYIAIRAVIDYELGERPDDTAFLSAVNLCLNSDNVPVEDKQKAQAFVEGAKRNGLATAAIIAGVTALVGVAISQVIFRKNDTALLSNSTKEWMSKIIKRKV